MINGTRRGWGVSVTPRLLLTPGKDPVPIVQGAGWTPGLVWTGAENFGPTGLRSPDCPAHSQSLYWVRYPAHYVTYSYDYFFPCFITSKLHCQLIRDAECAVQHKNCSYQIVLACSLFVIWRPDWFLFVVIVLTDVYTCLLRPGWFPMWTPLVRLSASELLRANCNQYNCILLG